MSNRSLAILQVSTSDIGGGAEKIAWCLFHAYRKRGFDSWLAVGQKFSSEQDVIFIPNKSQALWSRLCYGLAEGLKPLEYKWRALRQMGRCLHTMANPGREVERWLGFEDFNYSGTGRLFELLPHRPDVVHCHNLHGEYFDLRVLPWLSEQVPTILTLHDAWLLSGHCAHSFECERWKTGCGHCPDLSIYPPIKRDATAYNWRRKRALFARSRLYVATPSQWLMNKVNQSILAPAIVEARVIPNGVDLSVFRTADKQATRAGLGIPQDTKVLLFSANSIQDNIWKDYPTMRAAVAIMEGRLKKQTVLFLGLGESRQGERIGRTEIRFISHQKNPEAVARYYQVADVYVHAARADTFPNTILEALACGTPVVATTIGGIPEQVKGLEIFGLSTSDFTRYGVNEATGILVPVGNAEAMALGIDRFLSDEPLRRRIGENAARDARQRFDLRRQAEDYLCWYKECNRVKDDAKMLFQSHATGQICSRSGSPRIEYMPET